jgi:hypothetical protein
LADMARPRATTYVEVIIRFVARVSRLDEEVVQLVDREELEPSWEAA